MNATTVPLSNELQVALITTLIVSVIAPVIMLLLNKYFSRKSDGMETTSKALQLSKQAVDDLAETREEMRRRDELHERELAEVGREMERLKLAVTGRYRITFEVLTGPNPVILDSSVVLVPEREALVPAEVSPLDQD